MEEPITTKRIFRMRVAGLEVTIAPPYGVLYFQVDSRELYPIRDDLFQDLMEVENVTLAELPEEGEKGFALHTFERGACHRTEYLEGERAKQLRENTDRLLLANNALLSGFPFRVLHVHRRLMSASSDTFKRVWGYDEYRNIPDNSRDKQNLLLGWCQIQSGQPIPSRSFILEEVTDNPRFTPLGLMQGLRRPPRKRWRFGR